MPNANCWQKLMNSRWYFVHLQMIKRSLQPTIGTNVDVISGLKTSWALLPQSVFAIKVDIILLEAHTTDSSNFFRNVQVRIRYAGKVPASGSALLGVKTESIYVTAEVYFIIRHFIM